MRPETRVVICLPGAAGLRMAVQAEFLRHAERMILIERTYVRLTLKESALFRLPAGVYLRHLPKTRSEEPDTECKS